MDIKEYDLFGYMFASQFATDEEWAEIQEAIKALCAHEWEFDYGYADNHCIHCGILRPAAKA